MHPLTATSPGAKEGYFNAYAILTAVKEKQCASQKVILEAKVCFPPLSTHISMTAHFCHPWKLSQSTPNSPTVLCKLTFHSYTRKQPK